MTEHDVLARSFQLTGPDYDRYRPSFPPPAIDLLVPARVGGILDLGAGTGKLTELIVDRAERTYAVDPSARMLAVLRAKLPDVIAAIGSAEAIPLPDASVDVVVVAQAFHWFERDAACREIGRVLRPGGRLGLVWNGADPACAWDVACARIAHPERTASDAANVIDAAGGTETDDAGERLPGFTLRDEQHLVWAEDITRPDYLKRWHTVSTFLSADAGERARMTAEMEAVLDTDPSTRGRDVLALSQSTAVYIYDLVG